MSIKTSIVSGLTKEQAEGVKREFASSPNLRRRLVEMLEKDVTSVVDKMVDADLFDTPNWSLNQAEKIAEIRVIRKMINLLK